LTYDDAEKQFALRLQETLADKPALESIREVANGSAADTKGSTDVSDVSWVVPTGGFTTATWVPGTPAHSWQAVACGGTSIGKKGMQLAARTLAAMAWDLFQDSKLRAAAQAEYRERIGDRSYRPLIMPGQPPPLDYRDPARKGGGQGE
jgi:aminobenzoyl-glutamate utilization protein B